MKINGFVALRTTACYHVHLAHGCGTQHVLHFLYIVVSVLIAQWWRQLGWGDQKLVTVCALYEALHYFQLPASA